MSKVKVSYTYHSVTDGCGCCTYPASYFTYFYPDGRSATSDGNSFDYYDVGFAGDMDDMRSLMVQHFGTDWADHYEIDETECDFY